jgi:hypothetical protein
MGDDLGEVDDPHNLSWQNRIEGFIDGLPVVDE